MGLMFQNVGRLNVCTSGLMELVRELELKPKLWTLSPRNLKNYQFGIMMAVPLVKLREEIPTPTFTLLPSTGTHFVSAITSWFSAKLTSTTNYPLKLIIANLARKSWIGPRTKYHGLASNKSILFWLKTCTPLVGLKMVSLAHKDLTIAA